MPAIAALTVNGLAGADHVFTPADTKNGVVTWLKAGSAPVGDERLSISVNRGQSGRTKTILKLVLPKTQDVDVGGVIRPTVVRTAYINVEFTSDGTAPEADRYEMLDLLRSVLSYSDNPSISTAIALNQPFY